MSRIPELDALRGVAALVIMMFHLRFMGRHPGWGSGLDIDVFFILSGYLITTSILHGTRAMNFYRVFYFRRALRIWPIYYLVMGLCVLINPLLPRPDRLNESLVHLTFTQHVCEYWSAPPSYFSRFFQHTWTLAIEEQFYLFWPLVVRGLGRKRLALPLALLMIIPISLRLRGLMGHTLFTRCDSLALGSTLAVLLDDPERFRRHLGAFRRAFGLIALAGFSVPLWRDIALAPLQRAWPLLRWDTGVLAVEVFRVGLADFGLVGFVICSAGAPWLAWLRTRPLCYVGRISYSLYMYHPIVFGAVTLLHLRLGLRPSMWMDTAKAFACIGVASLSWHFFEQPILGLKDRLPYREEPATADTGQGHTELAGPHFELREARGTTLEQARAEPPGPDR